jgi:hypothetical protein
MREYDVEPTAAVIDEMADFLEASARSLRVLSAKMRDRNDLTYAAEAAHCAKNCLSSLRIDLLVTRPLRETMRD